MALVEIGHDAGLEGAGYQGRFKVFAPNSLSLTELILSQGGSRLLRAPGWAEQAGAGGAEQDGWQVCVFFSWF